MERVKALSVIGLILLVIVAVVWSLIKDLTATPAVQYLYTEEDYQCVLVTYRSSVSLQCDWSYPVKEGLRRSVK